MMSTMRPLLERIQTADPRTLTRAIDLCEEWEADFQARPRPTPQDYAWELTIVALPRIACGRDGVDGVGPDLAEAVLVLHLSEWWGDDPLFASIADAIAATANLMRKSNGSSYAAAAVARVMREPHGGAS